MSDTRDTSDVTARVLFLVDLHWTEKRPLSLPDLSGIDLVLLGGDLTNFRGPETAATLVAAMRGAGVEVFAVCGNCDLPEMEDWMRHEGIDLDRRSRAWRGIRLVGLSAGLPFGNLPYERTEDEFAEAAEAAFAAPEGAGLPTVLVSHQPPHGTRCDLTRGRHVGSHAVREAVLSRRPELVLCGHIHEAAATDRLGASTVVNPGPWFAGNQLRFTVAGGRIELDKASSHPD